MKMKDLSACVCLFLFCSTAVVFAGTAREGIPRLTWVNNKANAPSYMLHQTFHSKANKVEVGFYIYLPSGYDKSKNVRYPVIYSLHGMGGDEARNIPQVEILNKAIKDKQVPPVIMVLANGIKSSGYSDSHDGTLMIETMIIKELIPHIDKNFRTIAEKRGRAMQGFSMGGAGTMRLGLKHPELFSSLCPFSGTGIQEITELPKNGYKGVPKGQQKIKRYDAKHNMLGDDLEYWKANIGTEIIENNVENIRGKIGIHMTFGEKENPARKTELIQSIFTKHSIEYELVTHPYGHKWGDPEHVIAAFQFHFKHFGLTAPELADLKGSM